MGKRFLHFTLPLALFIASGFLHAAQPIRPGLVQLEDKSDRLCGTPLLMGQQERLAENTRRLSPHLSASLEKAGKSTHEVGDTLSFYTIDFVTSSYSTIQAVCMKKSSQTYIFAGVQDLDQDRVSTSDIERFYTTFELATPEGSLDPGKGIYSLVTSVFGNPPNRSNEGFVYILVHDIKDSYDPDQGKRLYVAGYFSPNDQTTGTYSNRKDLINVDCYPQNLAGEFAQATVAHEFQHLIHSGRDPDEDTDGLWVNEGASEYSEVLCGYSLRLPAYYLLHPERSLHAFDASDQNLLDYQKVALWTYYLAEKFGPELIGAIVKEPKNSIEGVRNALITRGITLSFEDIFTNFAIANYADDPSLDEIGYYSYNKIRLPSLPASTPHAVYPLKEQSKYLPTYSMGYLRFTGEDSTAQVILQGQPGSELRVRVLETGITQSLENVPLNTINAGFYTLKNIGLSADAVVMTAVSLGTTNSLKYSVSSELTDSTPPTILSGPRELVPTGRSVSISWKTNELASSIVEYGLSRAFGSSRVDTTLVTEHLITLNNLTPNTTYYYRAGSIDAYGNGPRYSGDFQFRTTTATDHLVESVEQGHSFAYSGRNLARAPDGMLHFLYHEVEGSRRFVCHKSSTDDGTTWSEAIKVDTTLFHSGMPSLAADKLGRLHAAWHARAVSATSLLNIYYSRSDDNGKSWSAPVRVSFAEDQKDVLYAAVAVDPAGNPHIVWNSALYDDDYAGDVYYNHSTTGGNTWAGDQMISSDGARRGHVPLLDFAANGEAWVIWADGLFEAGTRNVWCTRSVDYSAWSAPEAITTSGYLYDRYPSLVIDDQMAVHVAYSDNYSQGEIRIMYKEYRNGSWSSPIPIARSATGNVSAPSLTCDSLGTIALLYRDDLGSAALGRYVAAPSRLADSPVLAKPTAEAGDIFFAVRKEGEWIAGGNISNDALDSAYPETPRRVRPGSVDALWMRVVSTTQNEILYLHLPTMPVVSLQPLRVSTVNPGVNAVDVPYFKQTFSIQVEFDQRVISDSITAATFSVSSLAQGPLVGLITYDPSVRQLLFQASANLLPDDSITVRLKGSIPQEGGVGLDGNLNGIAEGSPVDDYFWGFRTASVDLQPPALTIGIAQNPVLTRYMDVYLFASELLLKSPTVEIAGTAVTAMRVPGDLPIYKADYKLDQNGILQIEVHGEDLAGNKGRGERQFSAQFVLAEKGGLLSSPDGRLSIVIEERGVQSDFYLTMVPETTGDSPLALSWLIGPSGLNLIQPATLKAAVPGSADQEYHFELQKSDGSWERLPGKTEKGVLTASTANLGNFRVAAVHQTIPQRFRLLQNYPNPFRLGQEKTTFILELPQRQEVEIAVYNLLGERIRTITKGIMNPGAHALIWDGLDENRQGVASGIYFYRCSMAGSSFTRKMLVLQ